MYLLDVNVLLALAYDEHTLHNRAAQWLKQVQSSCSTVRSLARRKPPPELGDPSKSND